MDATAEVTLETMAETMSKHHELRAQYGEPGFKPHFLAYLGSKGLDEPGWAQAWDSWRARLEADASGQLWGRFHELEGRLGAPGGDGEDIGQQVRGGLTLDTFARLSAELAQPGADVTAVLARHDVTAPVWQLGRAAWTEAMRLDASHEIMSRYERLYAKHDPQARQSVADLTAAWPDAPDTVDGALQNLRSPVARTRWRAAHVLAQKIQGELADDEERRQQALAACVPQLLDALEHVDKETVDSAEAAARDLVELEQFTDDVERAISRCILRAQEHLASLREALVLIEDLDVPERSELQAEIDGYTSLTLALEEILGEWEEQAGRRERVGAGRIPTALLGGDAKRGAANGKLGGFFKKIASLFRG